MSQFRPMRLKYVADYISRGEAPAYVDDDGIPVINQACVHPDGLRLDRVKWHDPEQRDKISSWVRQGDVLVNSTGTGTLGRAGFVAIAPAREMFVDGHVTLIRDEQKRFEPRFLFYVLSIHQETLTVECSEGSTNQIELSRSKLGNFLIQWPSLSDQRAIADHLDRETRRIDNLIAVKRQWLDSLSEKRTSIITLAVNYGITDGLSRPIEAPAHWTRMALKYACSGIRTGGTPTPEYMDADDEKNVLWFTPGDFSDNLSLSDSTRKLSQESITDEQAPLYPPYTVYVVGIGATLGKVGYCPVAASANQQVNALLPSPNADARYLAYRLSIAGDWMQALANTATLPILNQQRMGEMQMALPPLAEQRAIVTHIQTATIKIDALKTTTERSLDLLRERRAALIAEAVTGVVQFGI